MIYVRSLLLICLYWSSFDALANIQSIPPNPIVLVIGTRPEAIKMLPLFKALKNEGVPCVLCSTGQHAQMLDEIYTTFGIYPDVDFKIMKKGQDLFYITQEVQQRCQALFQQLQPRMAIVQGDTTTAMAAALTAFYLKIPIGHVEAGLRTGNIHAPFPEEMNRRLISLIASHHFAPTRAAAEQLKSENIPEEQIFYTGNTVVDALFTIRDKLEEGFLTPAKSLLDFFSVQKRAGRMTLLLTTHRRESIPDGTRSILEALKTLLTTRPDISIVFPMHPNPLIHQIVEELNLASLPQFFITGPLSYHDLVYTLTSVQGVLTDSGGIQEEAISLQKPLLILRNETDRPEGLQHGYAELVGTSYASLLAALHRVFSSQKNPADHSDPIYGDGHVYGDGHASERIARCIKQLVIDKEELCSLAP